MRAVTSLVVFGAMLALAGSAGAQQIDWDKVDAAFGRKAAAVAGDVHRYGFPRGLLLSLLLHAHKRDATRKAGPQDVAGAIARIFPAGKHQDGLPHGSIEAEAIAELYARLIDTDAFRVMLGRIAASYDGGQILE
jgi:hypothetical protein